MSVFASGHLGPRVSALLDGRLTPAEEERAWEHVHQCHPCRDQVEWEGAVKRRLAALGGLAAGPNEELQASLLSATAFSQGAAGAWETPRAGQQSFGGTRVRPMVAVGGVAMSAAMAGALLWAGLSPLLNNDVQPPTTSLTPTELEPMVQVSTLPSLEDAARGSRFNQDKWGESDPSGTMRR